MRVLLDENMPRKLVGCFEAGVEVRTIAQCGWKGVQNGALLRLAEQAFDVFVTMDKGIPHEQNLATFAIGIVLLEAYSNRFDDLEPLMSKVNQVLTTISDGQVVSVTV